MIRLRKSQTPPEGLKRAYNDDQVYRVLKEDQDKKCYLCERKLSTDYVVDHFIPQADRADLTKEWTNLFLACDYCNKRKSNKYNQLLNPVDHNIEELIDHTEAGNPQPVFTTTDTSAEAIQTKDLLTYLYSGGHEKFSPIRVEDFYKDYLQKINPFYEAVTKYLSTSEDSYRDSIINHLHIESELLGFKYSIILKHPTLFSDFGHLVVWNKA